MSDSTTCTVVVNAPAASPEQYEAVGGVFGAVLTALVLIWCAKQVGVLFTKRPEA